MSFPFEKEIDRFHEVMKSGKVILTVFLINITIRRTEKERVDHYLPYSHINHCRSGWCPTKSLYFWRTGSQLTSVLQPASGVPEDWRELVDSKHLRGIERWIQVGTNSDFPCWTGGCKSTLSVDVDFDMERSSYRSFDLHGTVPETAKWFHPLMTTAGMGKAGHHGLRLPSGYSRVKNFRTQRLVCGSKLNAQP